MIDSSRAEFEPATRGNFARVLALAWSSRALFGWFGALPWIAVVGSSGVTTLLDGDRALFAPGGLWLAELGRVSLSSFATTLRNLWPYFCVLGALWTLSEGLLVQQTFEPLSPLRAVVRGLLDKLGRLLALAFSEILVKGALLLIALLLAGVLGRLALSANEQLRDLFAVACAVLAGFGIAVVSVFAAVRRSLLFQNPKLGGVAFDRTLALMQQSAPSLASGYLVRLGVSALSLASVARLVELIDVGRPGALRVALVLLVHQGELFFLTFIDALWIARVNEGVCASATRGAAIDL